MEEVADESHIGRTVEFRLDPEAGNLTDRCLQNVRVLNLLLTPLPIDANNFWCSLSSTSYIFLLAVLLTNISVVS